MIPRIVVVLKIHAGGNGAIQHREFAMASGEMIEPEFISFLSTVLKLFCRYSVDGSVHYICMDWRHLYELLAAGREAYDALLNLCVWAKNAAGMGSLIRMRMKRVANPETNVRFSLRQWESLSTSKRWRLICALVPLTLAWNWMPLFTIVLLAEHRCLHRNAAKLGLR